MNILLNIHTTSTKTDRNGNRYHHGTITSVETGETIEIRGVGGPSHIRGMLRNMGLDCSEIYETSSTVSGLRDLPKSGAYEHELGLSVWKLLPRVLAVSLMGSMLSGWVKNIHRAVEIDSDGQYSGDYRKRENLFADRCRENIEHVCKGTANVKWPGIFAYVTFPDGYTITLGMAYCAPLAKRLLAE